MFRLYTSNDAAKLATRLGKRLRAPHANPLQPARVLVPQAGLKRWLQAHLAEQLGVIANVEFVPPAQFTWELLRAARPDLPAHSPFDVEVLRWHLYDLLGAPLEGKTLAPLREYLDGDRDPLRRYALSFELARAFERMQGYRREKLLKWERGEGSADWQAELWRRLLPRVGGSSRAARVDDWLRRFDPEHPGDPRPDQPAPAGLPERFACFACANVSPDVLRMLAVAGLHCDVDFYLPLPSREYLGDTPTSRKAVRERLRGKDGGNPLVTSLGGAAAEFLELLYAYEHVQPDEEIDLFDASIAQDTLLGRVRDDILRHAAPRGDDRAERLDDSLQFHACHTPLREVQTLHDALLAMLDDPRFEPPLQPREIAVMMPDVAAYRPAIDAVFGGIDRHDARHIPWNLGDLGAAARHPAAQLFLQLLDAPASRWELEELTGVLAASGVMRRFDLDADALERLRARLHDAGARWGEDKHARKRAGAGDYPEFSWAFAIDRIVAGFACGDAGDALVGDTAPLAGVEAQAIAHLDAVLAVTETWRHLRVESRQPRPAAGWQSLLNETFDALYQPDPDDLAETRALERVHAALAQLAAECAAAGAEQPLPWTVVRAHLADALAAPDPAARLFSGGVTFCGMVPLRVVPFRVICLLGMGEDAFPRREPQGLDPLAVDRRAGNAEPGDRDVRADDRLLFLQLLAAARDAFYVSWVGRDAQTNKSLPPSAMVADLMRLLREAYLADGDGKDALPHKAPLHPFAAELFPADAPQSYAGQWLPAAHARVRSDHPIPPFIAEGLATAADVPTEISLDELKRFLENPARGFLQQALRMRLPRDEDADADLEPLQPDQPLLRYQLTRAVLDDGDTAAERQKDLFRARGLLPPGALADAALAIARSRAGLLREERDAYVQDAAPTRCEGTLAFPDGLQLAGAVGDVYPQGLLRAEPGKLNGKRALRAWIDTLFVAAVRGEATACHLLWLENDEKAKHADIAAVEPAHARDVLASLLGLLHAGLSRPLPFVAGASWDSLRRWRVRDGEAGAREFAEHLRDAAADTDNDFAGNRDFDEAAMRIAWRGIDIANADSLDDWYRVAAQVLPRFEGVPVNDGGAP